jgi:hypothetical protein
VDVRILDIVLNKIKVHVPQQLLYEIQQDIQTVGLVNCQVEGTRFLAWQVLSDNHGYYVYTVESKEFSAKKYSLHCFILDPSTNS